jgi:hypothetical protein
VGTAKNEIQPKERDKSESEKNCPENLRCPECYESTRSQPDKREREEKSPEENRLF